MKKIINAAVAMAIVVGSLVTGGTAHAADSYFTNSVGSPSYNTAANWNPSGVPGVEDTAYFTNNAAYTVSWSASVTNANATFDAPGAKVVTLNPGVNTWGLTGALNVGPSATAATTLRLDGGNYTANSLYLTNVTAGGVGTSFLQLKKGTLTTTGDSEIRMSTNGVGSAYFMLGDQGVNGDVFTWKITNGTTRIFTPGPGGENQSALYVGRFNQWGRGILLVSGLGTVLTNLTQVYVGNATYGDLANSLTISNSAQAFVSGMFWIGRSCFNNQVVVDGSNSLLKAGGVVVGKNGARINSLIVTNGGRVATGGFGIEEGGKFARLVVTGTNSSFYSSPNNSGVGSLGGATSNTLLIANGASFYNGGNLQFGKNTTSFSPGNEIQVTGAGSTFTNVGTINYEGSNTNFRVTAGAGAYVGIWKPGSIGGIIEVAGANSLLSTDTGNLAGSMSLIVTNRGTYVNRGGAVYLGMYGGSAASVLVRDAGATFTSTGLPFRVAYVSDATITLQNGGRFDHTDLSSGFGLVLGYAASKTGTVVVAGANSVFNFTSAGYGPVAVGGSGVGRLVVTNQATFTFYSRNGLVVGSVAGAAGSTVLVADGGLLDFRRHPDNPDGITVGNYVGNSVSNIGGIFQFAFPAPNMTPGAFGNIVVNGGTLSFAGINTADVKGNWTGSLTNILFVGDNTFRLNAATNINNANQAYTFATGLGATNYATLALINGAQWRGGAATIGNGGTLLVGTGTNTVGAGVAFTSGGKLSVTMNGPGQSSYLLASGATVNLNNATLDFTLGMVPQKDLLYPILGTTGGGSITGNFQNTALTTSYGGTNYVLNVRNSGGTVSMVWASTGTLIRVL